MNICCEYSPAGSRGRPDSPCPVHTNPVEWLAWHNARRDPRVPVLDPQRLIDAAAIGEAVGWDADSMAEILDRQRRLS